ncbi:MAG: hypothetical protein ABIO40_00685 [Devosia sp.]
MLKLSQAALLAAILSTGIGAVSAQDLSLADNESWTDIIGDDGVDAGFSYSLSIPTVRAINSSMDEAALREALSGKILEHADELATLNATSITIPQLTLTYTTPGYGGPNTETLSYSDIVFDQVSNGVATIVTMGGGKMSSLAMSQEIGSFTMKDFDIGSLLAVFTPVASRPGAEMRTLYSSSETTGQKLSSDLFSCDIGGTKGGAVRARPPKVSFQDFAAAAERMNKIGTGEPEAEDFRLVIAFGADVLQAFEYDASSFSGLNCSGKGLDEKPFAIKLGPLQSGGLKGGKLSEITFGGLSIGSGDGEMSLGSGTFKALDFSGPIKTIEAAIAEITPQWFETNWRRLIPSWDGFALADLSVDVPDENLPGGRVKLDLASLDLTLADYINGIPSKLSSSAKGLVVPFAETSTNPQIVTLLGYGINGVDLGYDLSASWDGTSKTIRIDKIGVQGAGMGTLAIAATIGNAAEQIFAIDNNVALAALMGVTVKDLKIDVADTGLGNVAWPILAGQQGVDATSFRQKMAATAEGFAIALLGSTDTARQLGVALSNFVLGTAGSVSISIVANDPLGLPIPLLMQASENPAVLGSQVTITGTGQ